MFIITLQVPAPRKQATVLFRFTFLLFVIFLFFSSSSSIASFRVFFLFVSRCASRAGREEGNRMRRYIIFFNKEEKDKQQQYETIIQDTEK